jgi:hypothetical protein
MEFDAVVVVVWFVMADIKRIHPIDSGPPSPEHSVLMGRLKGRPSPHPIVSLTAAGKHQEHLEPSVRSSRQNRCHLMIPKLNTVGNLIECLTPNWVFACVLGGGGVFWAGRGRDGAADDFLMAFTELLKS